MIDQLDASLAELLRAEVLNSLDADIMFDAPDRDWSTRRTRPVVNAFLYDLREDVDRRGEHVRETRDADRRVVGRRQPPRWFAMSYLVSTWARRIDDEHRLLAAVLIALLRHDTLPASYRRGALIDSEFPVLLGVNPTPLRDRSTTEIWSTLGGQLHPALELSVTLAIDPSVDVPVEAPVTDGAYLRAVRVGREHPPAPHIARMRRRRVVPPRDRIEEP